jgi:MFS family permease
MFRVGGEGERRGRAIKGFDDVVQTVRQIAGNQIIVSMILLAGAASFIVGNAHQAQMPEFAQDLGHGDGGIHYSMLLAANALGAFIGGMVLESRGLLAPSTRTATILVICWCVAIGCFAFTTSYAVAVTMMLIAGFFNLAYSSMAQALIQLNAPQEIRGCVIGLYNMSANGLRAFSGITVGFGGSLIGIHYSLGLSAVALFFVTVAILSMTTWVPERRTAGE